jgi:hypothetical protein
MVMAVQVFEVIHKRLHLMSSSHSNYLNIVWYRMYFHCTSHSFRTNSCCYVLIISGEGDVSAGGRQKTEGNGE